MESRFDSGRGTMKTQLPQHERWRLRAACAGMATENYDVFYSASPGAARKLHDDRAKAICAQCPVSVECLDYADEHGISSGIWGGMTGHERGKRDDRHLPTLVESDEYAGTSERTPKRPGNVPAEFDLWDYQFSKDELEATVAARRRRREILDRIDAELDALEESA